MIVGGLVAGGNNMGGNFAKNDPATKATIIITMPGSPELVDAT